MMYAESRMPNILMLGPSRDAKGGVASVINTYYDLGIDQKCNVTFIPTANDGGTVSKLLIAVKAYIQFCKTLPECDVVHIHMAAQSSFYRKAVFVKKAHKKGKKIIIHEHSADFDEFYFKECNDAQRQEIRNVFSMADTVIVLSEEWESFFGQHVCAPDKIEVLHNGVAVPNYHKSDYTDHNVLFLGRLGKRKGSYDLLEAIPNILKKVPDAKFFLGGDGDVEQTQKIIDRKGLQEQVKLLGWVKAENKLKYFRECSVFVLPSYHEGMPMSVLEAMSYGLAAVSTNAGGIPQVIQNGVNGIRLEAGDVTAISRELSALLIDTERKKKLGNTARESIEKNFNVQNTVKQLINVYNSLL